MTARRSDLRTSDLRALDRFRAVSGKSSASYKPLRLKLSPWLPRIDLRRF